MSALDILRSTAMVTGYTFSAPLWEWESTTSWYFISLPDDDADDIDERFGRTAGGFGSIRVEVTIGASTWRTSLFPSTSEKTYLLPIKKAIRRAEHLDAGTIAEVHLTVVRD